MKAATCKGFDNWQILSQPAMDVFCSGTEWSSLRLCIDRFWTTSTRDTLGCSAWSSSPGRQSTGQTLMMTSKQRAETVCPVGNTRTNRPSLQSTHGCCRRSRGVAFTWTTRSTSWDPPGWFLWTPTPNTPASTQRSPSPLKLRLIY